MIILGIDLGKVRTGISICDAQEIMATPIKTIHQADRELLIQEISTLVSERKAQTVVVGLPRNMDGSEGESAQNARAFGAILAEVLKIPICFQDERGTTITAAQYLNATNTRGKKRKAAIDSLSAVIILQNYMDTRKNAKNSHEI